MNTSSHAEPIPAIAAGATPRTLADVLIRSPSAAAAPALLRQPVPAPGRAAASLLLGAAVLAQARLTGQRDAVLRQLTADGSAPVQDLWIAIDEAAAVADWLAHLAEASSDPSPEAPLRAPELALACAAAGQVERPAGLLALLGFDGAELWLQVDPARLDALAADCLLRAVRQCWTELSAASDSRLAALSLLSASDRANLLCHFQRPQARRPPGESLPARLRRIVETQPQHTALLHRERRLSYAGLWRRSGAIAVGLVEHGVRPGDVVGLYGPRSIEQLLAVIAVLRVGAAYLPLDPRLPTARMQLMLSETAARCVVLVGDAHLPALDAPAYAVAALEDAHDGDIALAEPGADARAYIMYTSGSTGRPKGVAIAQQSLLRVTCDIDYAAVGPDTRVLYVSPLSFDLSVFDIFAPLLNGGCCVIHDELVPTTAGLAETIREAAVEVAMLSAPLVNRAIDEDPQAFAPLSQLLIGGEAPSAEHVRRGQQALPGLEFINAYGPTECTVLATTFRVPRPLPEDWRSIPIGLPLAETSAHILAADGGLLPIGAVGEIHLGGSGVAIGYVEQPERERQVFIADPFGGPGERLYRTGDYGRRRADGSIEFLGRIDGQVKIRGFRIETAEVEHALRAVTGLPSIAVVAREDQPGQKRLVAYLVTAGDALERTALRARLAEELPDYMIPSAFVAVPALPLNHNGKLDRSRLPAPGSERPGLAQGFEPALGALEADLCRAFAAAIGVTPVGRHDSFFELGGDSLQATKMLAELKAAGTLDLPVAEFFAGPPTPARLARQARSRDEANPGDQQSASVAWMEARSAGIRGGWRTAPDSAALHPGYGSASGRSGESPIPYPESRLHDPIAIIAMAGRFPGAASVEQFWDNLLEGRDTIRFFTPDELDRSIPASLRADPDYVPARGVIDEVEWFDAAFFGISPREAELMDPQQRIFLELCWECIERAGHAPGDGEAGLRTGVFAGMWNSTYFQNHLFGRPEVAAFGEFQAMLDNEKDYLPTRVAHRLDLRGPAISVQTACSTSLVAVCEAFDQLRAGRCDMALAGGIAVTCPPASGYRYQAGAMLSKDGRTRSFDADSSGTVFCDGAAVLLLRRLSDALADGDPIHAVIRGAAVNNDGGDRASFTAPSVDGQADVVARALAVAAVDARSISYVEAHGTGTPLGDPVEIAGLTRAFAAHTSERGFCRIGSVKSNVGHLITAAGSAGLIKTALALQHEVLPASLHFERPNPQIDFDASPFRVNAELTSWPRVDGAPRRAGVTSLGVGGTNAHVIVEEAPALPPSEPASGPQLLQLSARSPAALAAVAERLAAHLDATPGLNLADVAYTLRAGRRALAVRGSVVASTVDEAALALRAAAPGFSRSRISAAATDVVFMFPGQGAQYPGMGRALYRGNATFRGAFDGCAAALRDDFGIDLHAVAFEGDASQLAQTALTQPATFAIEYALARLWLAAGLRPAAMLGHSIGEFVAATLAGCIAPADAIRLVARRGALLQALPAGAMLAVRLPAAALTERLPPTLSLAGDNADDACVASGPLEAIAALEVALQADGIACRRLQTSHAFHSSMMEPALDAFHAAAARIDWQPPQLPIQSTVTAEPLGAAACDPAYWTRHLRDTVRFRPALAALLGDRRRCLLEVGPRASLTALVRRQLAGPADGVEALASLGDAPEREWPAVLGAAGRLWARGVALDAGCFDARSRRQRLCLPSYPFERRRFWLPALLREAAGLAATPLAAAAPAAIKLRAPAIEPTGVDPPGGQGAELLRLLQEVAGLDPAQLDQATDLIEAGVDSLAMTQLALQLQQRFGLRVSFRELMQDYSVVGALLALVDGQRLPLAPPRHERSGAATRLSP
jgi:amino acid adenylation domain-containing protein